VLIHVVDFSGKTDIEGETTEGHDPREDIDFLEEELDEWYLDVLEKGLEKFETRYHADAPRSRRSSPSRCPRSASTKTG